MYNMTKGSVLQMQASKAQISLHMCMPRPPSWISDQNDFRYFWSTSDLDAFLLSFESICLLVQEKKLNIDFQDGHHGGHLGFPIRMTLAICYL